jgi:hypothetical protein
MDLPKPKTFGLKLSELRPCDSCGEKLVPFFHYIQIRHAIFNPKNANATLGILHGWGRTLTDPDAKRALDIAETLSPGGDAAVDVLDEPDAMTTLFICSNCFLKPLDLAMVAERRGHATQAKS